LRVTDGIGSSCEVNWLIDGLCGQTLTTAQLVEPLSRHNLERPSIGIVEAEAAPAVGQLVRPNLSRKIEVHHKIGKRWKSSAS
jgi:hypothetical protein